MTLRTGIIVENTRYISASLRRLDTLSRFLEVDQTCAAASMISGKLYISSNKLKYEYSNNFEIASMKAGVNLLQIFASKRLNQNVGFAYNRIYGSNIEEVRTKDALKSWCKTQKDQDIKTAYNYYKILTKESYNFSDPFKQYNYIEAVKFFLEELYPDKIEALNLRNKHKKTLKLMHENLGKMHARAYQDAHKIVELMATDKFPELKQALQNFEDGGFIFPYEESDEGKDHHAEMNIIRFIYENENSGEFYIGISKLSCVNCYNVIYSFSDQEQLEIFIRGAHKFQFPSRQPTIWEKQAKAEELEYFKPEVSLENASPLFADYSDSEPELELIGALASSAEAEL